MGLFLSGNLTAQAPANDDYANATHVSSYINGSSTDAAFTNFKATPDKNPGSNWNIIGPNYNVWFKFVATTDQINIAVDRGGLKGSKRYTQLALWEVDGVTELNSEHYSYEDEDVAIGYVGLTYGSTYYISVDTYNTGASGSFTLYLEDKSVRVPTVITNSRITYRVIKN